MLDFNPTQIYVDIMWEWMRTLRRVEVLGRPEELQPIDTVHTHDIVMIVQGIRDKFHVDTPAQTYMRPGAKKKWPLKDKYHKD